MEQLSFGLPALPRATVRLLFFALRPDAAVNAEVDRCLPVWRGRFGLRGKAMAPARRHVSLLALGPRTRLPAGHVERVCSAAAGFSCPPFEIRFDRIMRFGGNNIVLTGGNGNLATDAFRQDLATRLRNALPPQHGRFTPHMTLLHDRGASFATSEIEPLGWVVRDFVLVESYRGEGLHVEVDRWPLADGAAVPPIDALAAT
ncbi:2'-5' RNA ligase family protein [Mesorhizobium australicum]|uniref:2'-5' RNA ligase n=1 Tax=Mesorhizobium australicum TaxID=536018 RepID=A0A1X7NSA7_9HYPH|nr:2'-5' RNA ligase family protein [Mesorhizobium australicum]SMH40986.1 2'-5' RNA ligase [Mesorhizobium australicum]